MTMAFSCTVPQPDGGIQNIAVATGCSIIIIGANGSGKTRLGVHLENAITAKSVHRLSAQKSLALNDNLSVISLEHANNMLWYGTPDGSDVNKPGSRWGGKPATFPLSDFDALLQTLFAAHNRIASQHLEERRVRPDIPVPTTQLDRLKTIWSELLSHRRLEVHEASIKVRLPQEHNGVSYPGSEMSDGERAIFYFLGQCLVARENSVIIIDEPEVHVHKAILETLWDAVEKARPDCGFIYITHDLDFAVTHPASGKYFIRSYNREPEQWDIEEVPQDTGLPDQVVAELVGSRKPILFVEGERGSMDLTVYRALYNDFTIMPIGGCEAVIHSVASYRKSSVLHHLGAFGLIDADDRDEPEIARLKGQHIHVLPVSEVENLLLLPSVFLELAKAFYCAQPCVKLDGLLHEVMQEASANIDLVSARHATRQLDRKLKRLTLEDRDLVSLESSYKSGFSAIDPVAMFQDVKAKLQQHIDARNLSEVLRLYDNKGLLAKAARILGLKDQKQMMEKVGRLLGWKEGAEVRRALEAELPAITHVSSVSSFAS